MQKFIPISEQHKNSGFIKSSKYPFAVNQSVVPILKDEIGPLLGQMCLAFQKQKVGKNEIFNLVALQSLSENKNLFILPDGKWVKGYIPAYYRSYPFALVAGKKENQMALAIEEGQIKDATEDGVQPFFEEDGGVPEYFKGLVTFLDKMLKSRQVTVLLAGALGSAGLLKPWTIEFSVADEAGKPQKRKLEGLYHVDIDALKELPAEKLEPLNKAGALQLAYAQNYSEINLKTLANLQSAYKKVDAHFAKKDMAPEEPDLESLFDSNDDLLSF